MRRSTPGAFTGIDSHTPRICDPKSNSSFRTNSNDSGRCVPPPVPCRPQPPPLPPKHHLHKVTGVEFSKQLAPLEPLDSYGKDVYESINDSHVSSRPARNPALPRPYATRDLPPHASAATLGFRAISPHTIRLSCMGRSISGHAPYNDPRAINFPYSPPFAIDRNAELLRAPCTCSLGGGAKQSFSGKNQSPVWAKMPPVVPRPADTSPPTTSHVSAAAGIHEPNRLDKKSTHADNRPWTISRFSRTMSRFFRRKTSHRKGKSESIRSRSVYFGDLHDSANEKAQSPLLTPSAIKGMRSATATAVTLPSPPPSLPPPPPITRGNLPPGEFTNSATTTSSALLCCLDQPPITVGVEASVQHQTQPTKCGVAKSGVSCVHHVHHIHHVHHVHHHLHHMPPPSSQVAPAGVPGDDAAALVMMLENAATLGETPPPPPTQSSTTKDSKSTEQVAANSAGTHTYSAYGVRGSAVSGGAPATATCCPISLTPPPPPPSAINFSASTTTSLHRQSTTVCSNPRCIAAHCHHVQSSPGDHLRTPTSIELAELAEAGAEAVFGSGRPTTSSTDTCPPSPPTANGGGGGGVVVVPSSSSSSPNSPPTHLMHHMHHHHMHHMLHHVRPPSTPANITAATPSSCPPDSSANRCPTGDSTIAVPQTSTIVGTPNGAANSVAQDHRSSFQESMKALRKMGWYWGPLSFTEAEKLLANRPDGTFLVRDSAHDTFFLSLSFRVRGTTYHTRIEHNQGRFSFWFEPESHSASTVVEFIEKAVAHSIGGKYHYFLQTSTPGQRPVEVSLLYPLSRFQVVQSLRHLARFTILSHVRRDHVARLPLPPGQIGYLFEKQVYFESLEDFEAVIRDRPPLQFTSTSAAATAAAAAPKP
uniref:SH2 domain-containing protein n=1 Tax=Mesocestoides corti TaxID=53468 RepID=A0A5K3F5H3_MESCO